MKVELKGLTKKFPAPKQRGDTVTAVNDFDLLIPDGTLVALLGPSGCGKSTTLNMLCGLMMPTSGSILFEDEDVTNVPPENRGVGIVFQNYALYPHLTVLQNIRFPLENLKGKDRLSKDEMNERAKRAAALVQIDGLLDRKPGALSGGQQQRVAIARAIVKMPRVLLLDEPLSNLDARLRLQTREEIRRIQKKTGITTIFVTHDQDEAMSISDMIVVMKDGCLQQLGKPQEVYDDPKNLFVAKFLGTPPINIFSGRIESGALRIGDDRIFPVSSPEGGRLPEGEVTVGIRPEGFIPDPAGTLICRLDRVEVMGRDVSILSENSACETGVIRSIVDSDLSAADGASEVRYRLKPHKLFIFSKENGERIRYTVREE